MNPPKPIDLSQARTASLALDLDLDLDDEEAVAERQLSGGSGARRTLAGGRRYEPIFQDDEDAIDRSEVVAKPSDTKIGTRRDVPREEDDVG